MKRRPLIATVLGGIIGTAGCIDDLSERTNSAGSPEVNAGEPELTPGEEHTIFIEADNVESLQIQYADMESSGVIQFDANNATLSPQPDAAEDDSLPIWLWDNPTPVEIDVPLHIVDHADLGEYHYKVRASQGNGENRKSVSPEFTITVVEEEQ
ncbi:hypothetical protein OB905_05470 [Halobacteria archaeon AArc-dxtr1]|nr:hypothetical protein [Halobacteria archaeon AArc-dxtr1]